MSIFSSDTHRPSPVNVWQIPAAKLLPIPPGMFFRDLPLETQDTSYFALSAKTVSLSINSI
jgi:hypothetical protein